MSEKPAEKPAKELKGPGLSLQFMKDPMRWPLLYLPIKRRNPEGGLPDVALMFGEGPVIYHVNMWELVDLPVEAIKAKLDASKEVFLDYEGIIDAGWVVD